MTKTHTIAAIPGDGIGREVVPVALDVLQAAGAIHDFRIHATAVDWSCDRYLTTGVFIPPGGLEELRTADALLLGAVGHPEVPDHVSLWQLLIPIRRGFDLYANVRPVRLWPGVTSPLAVVAPHGLDILIVRENAEGEYSEVGGRIPSGHGDDVAVQLASFSRGGVRRIAQYAFERARVRRGILTSATKSNGIMHSMPFWDETVLEVAQTFPTVELRSVLIDALAARLIQRPSEFDVIVASNLFGDILSDLVAALAGGLGIAPSANIDPTRRNPSLFEPVHGSAPDIAGKGIANPIACVWSAAMMLDHLGERDGGRTIMQAIERTLLDGPRTADLGGSASTVDMGRALIEALK